MVMAMEDGMVQLVVQRNLSSLGEEGIAHTRNGDLVVLKSTSPWESQNRNVENANTAVETGGVCEEQIQDLLEPKGPLAICEDLDKGVVVQGLIFHQTFEKQQDWVPGLTQAVQVAKISLIDQIDAKLAFGAQEKREQQQEGANINHSLLALINIHNALADAKAKQHRPASTSG
ncbi:hypothetical protein P7K49_023502 [Saguinus oedipus]|uniref:Uncharacterized protein n=1 Tax=Saguinus oedipus TaxID=9490 RepID=A0ABQ9ULW0_SAGOE|nr:hypothetical protein P7K49_023502 [Saguinus oedipus]